jgi:signal transduction histidine kinase
VRTLHASSFAIRDEAGQIRWWAGVTRDVTDARHAEAELKAAHEDLEQRVAERTAALEAANEERLRTEAALAQAQRLETVGRLTGGVAHDFNNLLTVVIGALDMMLRQAERPDRVRKLGEAALTASRRGERLTRQLLAFSRRQEFKPETLEIAPVIRGFESLMRRAVEESTPFALEVQTGLGAVKLDAVQFEAALLNLVVNAKDAVEDGGGAITVKAERVNLHDGRLPDTPAGDYARISVVDTGMGMAPDVAARALEPFFTTKEVGKGTGLGLAQVYGFARQSGGGVEIESALGKGTAVSIYLPLVEAEATASAGAAAEEAALALQPGARVLLVEDDVGVRTVAENLLLELGCQVVTAGDGPSALATLEQTPNLDLLMTDIVMPGGMSGVELAEQARSRRPELKVLLSTGYAGELLNGEADHGWPVLRKPYRTEQLSDAVRRALQ